MKCNMRSVEAEWVGTWNSKLYCWSTTSVQNFKLDWRNLLNMLAKDLTEGKTSLQLALIRLNRRCSSLTSLSLPPSLQLDLIRLNRRCLSLTSLSLPPPPLPFSFKIPRSLNRKKNQHNKEHIHQEVCLQWIGQLFQY